MKKLYLKIETDGYTIKTELFDNISDAQIAMTAAYNNYKPNVEDWNEEDVSNSNISSTDAILYTGDNVYVWKIAHI